MKLEQPILIDEDEDDIFVENDPSLNPIEDSALLEEFKCEEPTEQPALKLPIET